MSLKTKEILPLQEAMDNLATIAEIDMSHPPLLGVVHETKLVTDTSELSVGAIQWLSSEGEEPILEILDRTYKTIYHHLLSLYQNPETDWTSKKFENGIAATMSLVGESATKIERYLAFREGERERVGKKIMDREEFKTLQQFYVDKFRKKFADQVEGDIAWSQEWEENEVESLKMMSGLKDFETVRRDEQYELFYIRNEELDPYFNNALLRNIRLTADLEMLQQSFEEDPLLKVRSIQDRDLQASSNQILGESHSLIQEFFHRSSEWSQWEMGKLLSKSVLALFLAANPRNLIQNTVGKSCFQYFTDFLSFLRQALKTNDYQKWIAYPSDSSKEISHLLIALAHRLSFALFARPGGVKQEAIGLIHRAMRRGEELVKASKKSLAKGDSFWNQLLIDDDYFRAFLSKFPNGPLFKILDLIREEEEGEIIPFDPLGQENFAYRLYRIETKQKMIDVLRLPSPIRQAQINRCEIVEEFQGFLRHLQNEKKRHLLVNLNDKTSWREYARAKALESLQMKAENAKTFFVFTLPKQTDFYYQNQEYFNLNDAGEFCKVLEEQMKAPQEHGFSLPSQWKLSDFYQFSQKIISLIHTHFFDNAKTLSRRNREDFIEIFYQFLILKALEVVGATSCSFTCKDAIDLGAAESVTFYGLIKLLHQDFSKKEERDFLLWLYYAPALFIRERAILPDSLNRSLSALERIDKELFEKEGQIMGEIGKLFDTGFFESLKVIH